MMIFFIIRRSRGMKKYAHRNSFKIIKDNHLFRGKINAYFPSNGFRMIMPPIIQWQRDSLSGWLFHGIYDLVPEAYTGKAAAFCIIDAPKNQYAANSTETEKVALKERVREILQRSDFILIEGVGISVLNILESEQSLEALITATIAYVRPVPTPAPKTHEFTKPLF